MNIEMIERRYLEHCYLCHEPKCSIACGKMDCGALLKNVKLRNSKGALRRIPDEVPCKGCDKRCESECVNSGRVPIAFIMENLCEAKVKNSVEIDESIDIGTDLCGIKMENPFMLSSSVVGSSYEMIARAFEMGWAGVAFKTICLFPIEEASPRFSATHDIDGSFRGFKNIEQLSEHSVEENLSIFRRLKEDYPDKVLMASIMGRDEAEWTYLAKLVTEAGVDAIECNFSCPNMMDTKLGSDVGQSPELVEKFTRAVCEATDLPVIAKMTPNVASMIPPAIAAEEGGANGISAINTIKSICSVNLDTYATEPSVNGMSSVGGYSGRAVKPIALRFISELSHCEDLRGMHISAMGGVYSWKDAVEYLLLGAKSIQITTAIMEYGYRIIEDLTEGLKIYLKQKNMKSVQELIGLSVDAIVETADLDRTTILYPSFNYDSCVGCGRCYISCRDGGHSAIRFDVNDRKPILDGKKCVGCHLCVLVCPEFSISPSSKRVRKRR